MHAIKPPTAQTVRKKGTKVVTQQRKRIGPLDIAGSVAVENAKVYKELRRGRIEPSLASRLSQILINQRVILESFEAEKRIAQLEALLEESGRGRLLQLKANG
jgi:actin-like ATPase involved in cell morphogenesis